MAGSSDIRAGSAFVELYANSKKLTAGLTAASNKIKAWSKSAQASIGGFGQALQSKLAGFGSQLTNLGKWGMTASGVIGGGLLAASKQFADAGDKFEKMAHRTGMVTEALSELSYAAGLCGTDIETMEKSIHKMQTLMMEAGEGSQGAMDKLASLGLTYRQLSKLSPEKQFLTLIDRLGGIKNDGDRAARAIDIFGKSASGMLPFINAGSKSIEQMRQEARRLGVSMSGTDAKAAADYTDALHRLTSLFHGIVNTIGSALAPELTNLVNLLVKLVAPVIQWIKANKELIITITKWTAIVFAASVGLLGFGTAVTAFGVIAGGVFSAVAGLVGLVGSAIAFLISPIGLVIAAVVGIGGYFLYEFGVINSGIEWLKGAFGSLFSTATKAWKGIQDALAAGRLDLVFKVAWAGIKVVWTQGINFLLEWWYWLQNLLLSTWDKVILTLVSAWDTAVYSIASILVKVWAAVKSFWINSLTAFQASFVIMVKAIGDVWRAGMKGFRDTWDTSSTFVAQGIGWIIAKLQGLDPAEMAKIIEEDHQTRANERKREYDAAVNDADAKYQNNMAAIGQKNIDENDKIEKDKQGTLDVLTDDYNVKQAGRQADYDAKQSGRKSDYDAKIKGLESDEQKAKDELNAAVKAAGIAKAKFKPDEEVKRPKQEIAYEPPEWFEPNFQKLKEGQNAAAENAPSKTKTSSTGTFNAAAAQSLMTSGPMDKVAKNTEETAKYIKKLYEKPNTATVS